MTAGEWAVEDYDLDITDGTENTLCQGVCGKTTQVVLDDFGQRILTGLARDSSTGLLWCGVDFDAVKTTPILTHGLNAPSSDTSTDGEVTTP